MVSIPVINVDKGWADLAKMIQNTVNCLVGLLCHKSNKTSFLGRGTKMDRFQLGGTDVS